VEKVKSALLAASACYAANFSVFHCRLFWMHQIVKLLLYSALAYFIYLLLRFIF
jgi:hypothetical protein